MPLVDKSITKSMTDKENNSAAGQSATQAEQGQGGNNNVTANEVVAEAAAEARFIPYGTEWFWVTFSDNGARTFQVSEDVNNNVPDNNWN